MIKKIRIEILALTLLVLSVFFKFNFDILISNYFNGFENTQSKIYLKKFFIQITELGDSLWSFLIIFFVFVFSFFLKKKLSKINDKIYTNIKYGSLFLFIGIIISGLITQILKHFFGRARPNQSSENIFNFFNLDSSFHSFPSGHTSTIFFVALGLSLFTPKIKFFYLSSALLISLSRIVVGAHYATDVIGGIVISFIGYKITLFLFEKLNIKKHIKPSNKISPNIFLLSLLVFAIGVILVSVGISLDLYISSLFYLGEKQFVLQNLNLITIIARKIFLPFLIVYIFILPLISFYLPIQKIYFNYKFNLKQIFFVFVLSLFNLIVVVNIVLKNFWGRGRPNDIFEFGGDKIFTPWFKYSDACSSNCSFVSGDASVGFSLIVFYLITKNIIFFWLALVSGLFLGVIRILEGGHFISDVLISGFLIFVLCLFQFKYYFKK